MIITVIITMRLQFSMIR